MSVCDRPINIVAGNLTQMCLRQATGGAGLGCRDLYCIVLYCTGVACTGLILYCTVLCLVGMEGLITQDDN